jgi:SAM-dependent methyltransferase
LRIDIGCGAAKKPGYVGIDKMAAPGVDIVVDFERERLPFRTDSIEAMYSSHCLEHLADPHLLLGELLRVGRDGAPFELWLPYLKSDDAFVFDHRMFYNELIMARISATAVDFWFAETEGLMQLERVIYVLRPGIAEELDSLALPLHFAIKHLLNVVLEWGLFFTVRKGPDYRDRAAYGANTQPPPLFSANNRDDTPRPLTVPPGFWEMR